MEDFRTVLSLRKGVELTHADRLVCLGSCFADRISRYLQNGGFRVEANPFGVLYNPISIVKSLERLWLEFPFTKDDLFQHEGVWGSFMHHTSFSGPDPEAVLEGIRASFDRASAALREATCLMLTFGTARVYALAQTGKVVSNCHKLPSHLFVGRRLEVAEITEYYTEFFQTLFEQRPGLKVILTVSPIRHLKDGFHENSLSKAVLHLACEELCLAFPDHVVYFPSYELLTDDLRDYRFYDEDMVHPTETAVRYIWAKFQDFAFDRPTREVITQVEAVHRAMEHRPFRPDAEAYRNFAKKNLMAIEVLQSREPRLDLQRERQFFTDII